MHIALHQSSKTLLSPPSICIAEPANIRCLHYFSDCLNHLEMVSKGPRKEDPKFTEPQLQAEICRQELQESDNRSRQQLKSLMITYGEIRERVRKEDISQLPSEYNHFFAAWRTLCEERIHLQTAKAHLNAYYTREDWRKAKTISGRVAIVRKWTPYWLRRNLKEKPMLRVALWCARVIFKLQRYLPR